MLEAAEREHADALGMSGLLVKSTAIMKENLEVMESRNIRIPVVLGGAALTRKFVEKDLHALYSGPLSYAQDAFDGLHFMEKLKNPAASAPQTKPEEKKALTRDEMIARLRETRVESLKILQSIDEEEYHVSESFGLWSLRDVIAHLIGWERLAAERLARIQAGKAIVPIDSAADNEFNARFVSEIDTREKDELLDLLENARHEVLTLLKTLSQEVFDGADTVVPNIQHWLPNFTFAHEAEHLAKVKTWLETKEEELDNATGAESKIVMASRVGDAAASGRPTLPWLVRPTNTTSAGAKSIEVETMQERIANFPVTVRKMETDTGTDRLVRTSATPHDNPIPTPPFWGSRVVTDIKLEKVWEYLNEVALFRGQWQMKRGKKSVEDFERQIVEVARPKLQEFKLRAKRDRVLEPKVVYGYFPCWAEGEDLVILKPKSLGADTIYEPWNNTFLLDELEEWARFTFPRQPTGRALCLSDFFLPKEEAHRHNQPDVVAFTAVTVGREASRYTANLFETNQYADYLFMHGLSVETAEALAEYWHKIVRTELGIAGHDAKDTIRLFSQGYQGSRYSFGYPACPNLEDQTKLFGLIRPDRIDVTLTEEYHIEPEQSTTAIVAHHPNAKYFSIK